ncbi:MAG TPA: pyroglutamyl-peptidase I [Rhodanobacteraceae bacterium]|nr:pyroglutamyl-peptidase I [Rhodanobacteraceae bacterium]
MKPADRNQQPVLLTGFAPFAGEPINPSWQAARALDGATIEGRRVIAVELPTEFDGSLRALRKALRETNPKVAVAVGLAGGRAGISLERVAINVIDARIPDNAGAQPVDQPIVQRGPTAYFSTLPIKAALTALRDAGVEAHISQTAGTYVCNHVFYALMHAARRTGMRAGFVHVPYLPEQARRHHAPGMPLDQMVDGLRIIARTALHVGADVRVAGGAEM